MAQVIFPGQPQSMFCAQPAPEPPSNFFPSSLKACFVPTTYWSHPAIFPRAASKHVLCPMRIGVTQQFFPEQPKSMFCAQPELEPPSNLSPDSPKACFVPNSNRIHPANFPRTAQKHVLCPTRTGATQQFFPKQPKSMFCVQPEPDPPSNS